MSNNVLLSILLFGILIALYSFYQIVAKVYLKIMWRKFQLGDMACTYFHPVTGLFQLNKREDNPEDHLGHKMTVDPILNNPKSKVLISNFKSEVVWYLHDPDMIQ